MTGQLYGLLAEFPTADALIDAVSRVRGQPFAGRVEAYSPFAIDGLAESLGGRADRIAPAMLLGALVGGLGTYALEWYSAVHDYPLNVGGRPLASWPAFLPPALEITLLGAALAGVIAMLLGNGLPRLHHPLFAVEAFERASSDRFFLLLRPEGASFDAAAARSFLQSLAPLSVAEVPA
ncbi:MAG TPA: DUF3341 domain-containing protein [Steroidobacteraceae bacterium]|nr:DUF3341 domain-containing protein [Steroidobacteraceae bacterium]